MSDDRWQRIEEVFHHAVELPNDSREAFLASACGADQELRREVESLLANDDSEDNVVAAAVSGAVEQLPDESAAASQDFVGRQIGVYLITELIGKGGMGLVFKARDTQLNRSVAIKALPMDRLADPERKRRFLQEAKATSALNHPNIVTVHSITHAGDTDFIVMEYVTGKTLEQLIPHKGLPMKQAIQCAIEIADAIAAAHAAGIVHRDLKPSNIMVTEQGRVKVLDFGLAKLTEPPAGAEQAMDEPLATKSGLIFGTAAYMSPEQAQGKPADARSDVFSFGALFYQMLTGRRAFPGENVITILAAVLQKEPAPLETLAAGAPRELEWIITRCLKKDPDRRIQHMLEVKIALTDVLERIDSPSASPPAPRARRVWIAPAVLALLLGLAPGAWLGQRIFRKQPVTFQRITFRQGDVYTARFAPNGAVVYSAKWDGAQPALFSAQPGNREARDLGLPAGNLQSISSKGEMAILIGGGESGTTGTLARVPLSGGAPRSVLENVSFADWSPDGISLAVMRTTEGRHRVEYPIGTVLYETQALRMPLYLRVSPQGGSVAFFDFTDVGDYSLNVVDAQKRRQILSRGWRAVGGEVWSPDGKEIWFGGIRSGAEPGVYAVDLSGRERLLTQVAGNGVLYDLAKDGRLLLSNSDSRIGIRWLGRGAKEERDLAWLDASSVWSMSDDGKQIVFAELSTGEGRNSAIYLRRTDGSPAVRLGYGNRPALSPDGKWVVCVRRDRDGSRLLLLPTGAGEEKLLSTGAIQAETAEWFPDGRRLLVTGGEANQPPRSYVLDRETGQAKAVTAAGMRASRVSPDGQFAVVVRNGKLNLHSLTGSREVTLAPIDPGISVIRWTEDGHYLFLQGKDEERQGATIFRMNARTGRQEVWREIKPPDLSSLLFGQARLSADGESYAFSFQRDLATLFIVQGVK